MAAFNVKRKEQTLEELLVTDELFCEYFNVFLSLPVFPEPIRFNRETNGFEIVTLASKNIAKEIKALLRAAKRRDRIYDATQLNSYTDLMLLPMEEEVLPDEKEVSTVFAVQTLNKDQGIEWIKACRLAAFLNSDTYHEYRLAMLLSQGRLDPQNAEEFSDVHIVSDRRRKTTLSATSSGTQGASTASENSVAGDQMESGISSDDDRESDDEMLMRDMYVNNGNTSSAETKAWLVQARQAMCDGTTGVSSRPNTSTLLLSHTNSTTRPKSAASFADRLDGSRSGHSTSRSIATSTDSGRGSAVDMLNSLLGPSSSTRAASSKSSASTTTTHQPTDSECAILDSKMIGPVIKVAPRLRFADDNGFNDAEDISAAHEELPATESSDAALENHEDQDRSGEDVSADTNSEETAEDNYEFIEEFIKEILRQALEQFADETVERQEDITTEVDGDENRDANETSVVSDAEYKNTEETGERIATPTATEMPATTESVTEKPESPVDIASAIIISENGESGAVEEVLPGGSESNGSADVVIANGDDSENTTATTAAISTTSEEKKKKRISESEENKDKDSLLDSDEDDESSLDGTTRGGGRDLTFARNSSASKRSASSAKTKALCKRREVMQFRKFLDGTEGEKAWCLWLDVERAKLIRDNTRMMDYFAIMRELYYRSGAPLELCREVKWQLGLAEPADWTILGKFVHAQNRLLESLLVYWVPSFLLQANGDPLTSNFLYYHQKVLLAPANRYSTNDHKPKPLLPLRPKTCKPGLRPAVTTIDQTLTSKRPVTSHSIGQPVRPMTSPAVGVNKIRRMLQSARGHSQMTDGADAKVKVESINGVTKKTPQVTKEEEEKAKLQLLTNQMLADDAGIAMPETEMPRMEGLLQTLDCEGHSGHVLRRYIEKTRNLVCRRCLDFWEELQRYHWLFYRDNFDPELVAKKSKLLHSHFIVIGSEQDIGCDNPTRVAVNRELNPPFEDLFDMAEDYALQTLYQAWSDMIIADNNAFEKIELIEVSRHLGRTSKYIINMKKRGLVQRVEADGEDEMMLEDCEEPEYDPTLIDKVAPEFRNMTLEKLCRNRVELEHFRQFLAEADKLAAIDLACFLDIEAYRCLPHSEEKLRRLKAKDIKKKYLNKNYFFGPNSPAGREGQEKVVEVGGGWGKFLADVPPTESILEAQKYVRDRLEKHWLLLFLASPEFVERQAPKATVGEAVEDLLIQTRKRQQLITRMLESRWVSESKDLLNFRKALANPVTSLYFRRYVSIKGDCYENDVLFWQEVQRYKELCHMHSDKSLIVQKTTAIVNCFVDSALTPSLQIDITTEMAEKIIDRRYEASPYLFREAQLTVFRILYEHWTPFCQFRTKLTDDKVLPTIERHRRRARAKEQKRKDKEKDTKPHKDDQQDGSRPVSGMETDDAENAMTPTATSASPFGGGRAATASDDGWEMGSGSRTQVSWSYSQYVKALDRETIVADNDESTLSLLSGTTGKEQTTEETNGRKRGVSESKRDDGRNSKKKEVAFAETTSTTSLAMKNSTTSNNLATQPKKTTSEVVELPPVQRMSSAKGHRRAPADVGQGQAKK